MGRLVVKGGIHGEFMGADEKNFDLPPPRPPASDAPLQPNLATGPGINFRGRQKYLSFGGRGGFQLETFEDEHFLQCRKCSAAAAPPPLPSPNPLAPSKGVLT